VNRPAGAARTASRSLLATVEITALASVAHVLAGGRLPTPGFLLAFAGVVFGCALLTIGRLLRVAAVVPFVLFCQIGLHASLDSVHAHSGIVEHAASPILSLSGPMLWAHLVTTVVTAIVLLLQERVLAAVVAALGVLGATQVLNGPSRPRTPLLVRAGRQVLLATSPRRGPPRVLGATS